jgi:hypothetical protein
MSSKNVMNLKTAVGTAGQAESLVPQRFQGFTAIFGAVGVRYCNQLFIKTLVFR